MTVNQFSTIKTRLKKASSPESWMQVDDEGELTIKIDDLENSVVIWCGLMTILGTKQVIMDQLETES